jgi:ATP phosphoribosyltransferase
VIKLALPTGDLRAPVAEMLSARGIHVEGYAEGSRQIRSLPVTSHEQVRTRVFREKDIPMQVALGNYDFGITNLAWVLEMQVRFPSQPVALLADLGFDRKAIIAAASREAAPTLEDLGKLPLVRLASDLPNIAEALARALRLRRYRVQAVKGAAEAYPPEDADCVVIADKDDSVAAAHGLAPLTRILEASAWLIANTESLGTKTLEPLLSLLSGGTVSARPADLALPRPLSAQPGDGDRPPRATVRLAVPDGHQQRHVVEALGEAGLRFSGYDDKSSVRRPGSGIEGLEVKVIRPQDMPQLVALGEFDLAITGRDLMHEHLFEFPSSPVIELIDLQRGQYDLSAVVDGDLAAETMEEAVEFWRSRGKDVITVAAEFPVTADHYARSRRFRRYQVVPIAGASEGFVPEDADVLIEGTETGKTIAENNLKVIDTLYRSTTCVIGNRDARLTGRRKTVYEHVLARLSKAGQPAAV